MRYFARQREENKRIREYFATCMDRINESNQYMLRKLCMYVSIVYIIMMPIAFLTLPEFKITPAHICLIPLLIIYYFINLRTLKRTIRSTNLTAFICGAFFFWLAVFFAHMDVMGYGGAQSYWLPMLLIIYPTLYIDRMYKYGIEGMIMMLLFWGISFVYNTRAALYRDMYVSLASYIISMFVAHITLEVRSSEGLAQNELKQLSALDKLTHVLNKGAFLQKAEMYLLQKPPKEFCAIIVVDLDDFKQVNDNLGHNTGDLLLERVGQLLIDSFRAGDIIGRYGGDEFVVLLPQMGDETILQMRCRTLQMFLTDFSVGNGKPFSVSVGGVICRQMKSIEEIFSMADDALYKSKLDGKNNCTTWIAEEKTYIKPIFLTVVEQEHSNISEMYKAHGEKNEILTVMNDNDALSRISQYHSQIRLLVIEISSANSAGARVLKYVKAREAFEKIPVLAVAISPEASFIAKDLGANEVIMINSPVEEFARAVKQLLT